MGGEKISGTAHCLHHADNNFSWLCVNVVDATHEGYSTLPSPDSYHEKGKNRVKCVVLFSAYVIYDSLILSVRERVGWKQGKKYYPTNI